FGIRDRNVTGGQTCALPIYRIPPNGYEIFVPFSTGASGCNKITSSSSGTPPSTSTSDLYRAIIIGGKLTTAATCLPINFSGVYRSEERRVGKQCGHGL